ncbi:restriction endonuclease subunit S [Mycoplasmopsis felis]|uniref:restriction endonuclease subunit S n=1 Tax=Mycoplasmopsis felis TaxID=33923 RepID=UPI002FEF799D
MFKNSITWTTDGANAGTVLYRDGLFYATNVCGVMLQKTSIKPSSYFAHEINVKVKKHVIKAGNPKLMINVLHEVLINFSKNKLEQEKISILIENIDNLITLEEIKHNKLKQLKETLLQKMFPEGNSKTPRIRFKGFDEEWKEEVLGKIIKSAYIGISSKILITGKYEVIQQGITNIAGYTNEQIFENYEKIVLFGDHSLSVYKPKKPFLLASDGIKAYFIENTYGDYFYYLLGNNLPENEGYKRYSLILKEKNIWITYNKSEQQKIGDFFCKIDTLLDLYNSKLNKLKQIKEALLQKMFV